MFKWVSWAARTVVTAVLLSFLCIWTTGYIVNSYMETLLKQLDLPLQTQPFALSGIWGKMWGADPVSKATETLEPVSAGKNNSGSQPSPSSSPISGPSSPDTGKAEGDAPITSPSPSDSPAVPVFEADAGTSEMTEQQRQLVNEVMTRLNAEQLAKLTAFLEDGLTKDELTQLGEMIKTSLSEEQYTQMMELLQARVETSPAPSDQP